MAGANLAGDLAAERFHVCLTAPPLDQLALSHLARTTMEKVAILGRVAEAKGGFDV